MYLTDRQIVQNGQHRQIDQLYFAGFLSPYYILRKIAQISKNYCHQVVLNDKHMVLNHDESRLLDQNPN